MVWYTQGTISLYNGQTDVLGIGTEFENEIHFGDILMVEGGLYEIEKPLSNNGIRLRLPWPGPELREVSYAIIRNMTNATNYDLIFRIDEIIRDRHQSLAELITWINGKVSGGPNSDGFYPLTDRVGNVKLVKCPALMEAQAGTDYAEQVASLNEAVELIQLKLANYSEVVRTVNSQVGDVVIDLDGLNGQTKNLRLSNISELTLQVGDILYAMTENTVGALPTSALGRSLMQAQNQSTAKSILGIAPGSSGAGASGASVGRRVAVIGTSLVQLCAYGTEVELSHTSRSWIQWASALSNGAIITPIWPDQGLYPGWEQGSNVGIPRGWRGLNAGVSSDTSENILARSGYLIDSVDCDIVIIDSGGNVSGLTPEQIQSYREQTADFFLEKGKLVILLTLPWSSVARLPDGNLYRKAAGWMNQRTRNFALTRHNCHVFDWTEQMLDFRGLVAEPKAEFTVDGAHFSPKGAFAVGKALAKFIQDLGIPDAPRRVYSQDDKYDAVYNPLGNLMSGPFMIGTSGILGTGATGQVASYYRGEIGAGAGSVAFAKEVRADGRGDWQKITVTPDAAADNTAYFRVSDFTHNLPAGTWVQASVEIEVEGWDGWRSINLYLRDLADTGFTANACKPYTGFKMTNESWKATLVTPAIQVVEGSSLRWRVELSAVAGAVGTGVVRVGATELRPVVNPRELVNAR